MSAMLKRWGEAAGLPPEICAHPGVKDLVRRAMEYQREADARICEKQIDPEWPGDDISRMAEQCASVVRDTAIALRPWVDLAGLPEWPDDVPEVAGRE